MELRFKEADRWLRQAENDLKASEWNQQGGFYSSACFLAQQSAAKALRSFLFLESEDAREARSVADLLDRAMTYEEEFRKFVGSSTSLDIYYKTARFPDALPGGIPAEVISNKDSRDAIKQASDILSVVEKKRKDYLPDTL
ncbi:MAG: HEPN domain-containing protein [Deltaproteobacteria bacterium]|nr:HEPN domain-containing protein [Deltaproteobacteria bacterium]MBI5903857.1 HEPN domain-containing protein [Deltaproteobacteria bacterium]